MDTLLEFLTKEECIEVIEENPDIKNLTEEEIKRKIEFLIELGCNPKNILLENPFYLSRELLDCKKTMNYLNELSITYLNLFIESYPNILNKDVYEIKEWMKKKEKSLSLNERIDLLESYPNLIEEE